jgi:signal transduction histidine kinase
VRADLRMPVTGPSVSGIRWSLWRAVTVFRVAALAIDLVLIVRWRHLYERPGLALATAAAMIVVTVAVGGLAVTGRAHRPAVVTADALATMGLTLLSIPVQTTSQQHGGMITLTSIWAAGPTLEAAFVAGPAGGLAVAVLQYLSSVVVADNGAGRTLYSGALLALAGTVVGVVTRLAVRAEDDLRAASAAQAAVAERERLTRQIHDGVLQVLGLVHRTGRDAGGPWPAIAAAAAEQESALRGLITSRPVEPATDGVVAELGAALRSLRSTRVTVSTPVEPVTLPAAATTTVADAVRAALHNVDQHAGPDAHAWVLLEDVDDAVRVTIRDDGAGMTGDRLAEAVGQGRVGVARSIRGRIEELGGTCTVVSAPGEGTEIDMQIPLTVVRG